MKRIVCLLVLASAFFGCGKTKPTAASPKPIASEPVASHADDGDEVVFEEVVIVDRSKPDLKPEPEAELEAESVQPQPEDKTIPRTARVMLLSDEGPLLIDLHVTRDGDDALARFDQAVDEIMQVAGGEDSDPLTWETMLNHPRFRNGEFGNPAVGTYDEQVNMIRQYDTTKNGRVDRNEFVRYLTNNQSSRSMSLITSNDRRNEGRDASPVRLLLDQNDDRQLDAGELLASAQRLRTRDSDDDDILTPGELVDAAAGSDAMVMTRTRRRYRNLDPKSGWLLESDGGQRWSNIRIAWETLYAGGQSVEPKDIGERLFNELDLDVDGRIDNTEMEMLVEIEPDLALQIEMTSQPPEISLLASRLPKESIHALLQHQSNRITIRLPHTTLDLFAGKTQSNETRDQAAARFQMVDTDQDGSLSTTEFEAANSPTTVPFGSIDIDGDEMITLAELETSFRQRTAVVDSHLRIRADHQNDALFSVIDLNADGRLDGREIEAAPESLQSLDRNGDAVVRNREIHDAMVLGVVLGGSSTPSDPLLQVPPVRRTTTESVPDWFSGMDRNDDQTISWREFLGTREQFADLDADSDGFVDAVEAAATRG